MPQVATTGDDPNERLRRTEKRLEAVERRLYQTTSLSDSIGNVVVSADPVVGIGLGRPYLPIPWMPARLEPNFWTTTSAGLDTMWTAEVYKQHPNAVVTVGCYGSGDAAGNVLLIAGGTAVGTVQPFASGINVRLTFGPFPLPGNHGDLITLYLAAQRTAGTSEITIWPGDSWSLQA